MTYRTIAAGFALATLIALPAVADKAALMEPSKLLEEAPDVFNVEIEASNGTFVIEVHREWAPLGADRFYNLVKHGFYDEARFFRVVPNFVVQFGLNGDPEISKAWREARIKDERVRQSNQPGYVTFAKQNLPHTRTTQIFINLKNNAGLDRQGFAPFGKVVQGMEVVRGIYSGYQAADQGRIMQLGNEYLKADFPKMDYIKKATVVPVTREAEPEAKPATEAEPTKPGS